MTDPSTKTECYFGSINTVTGEQKTGYIDHTGRMRYRTPLPWWKRMLGIKSYRPVFTDWYTIGTVNGSQTVLSMGMSANTIPIQTVIQKRTNFYTHKNEYRCKDVEGCWQSIDVVAYETLGKVVCV